LCTQFQVKRTWTVTASDGEFVDVVSKALGVLKHRAEEVQRGELELGLIVEGKPTPVDQLAQLTSWARAHAWHTSFCCDARLGRRE
jgi:hypothetical protein